MELAKDIIKECQDQLETIPKDEYIYYLNSVNNT